VVNFTFSFKKVEEKAPFSKKRKKVGNLNHLVGKSGKASRLTFEE